MSLVVNGNEETSRSTEDDAELLASETHRWRVDERHHLLNVLGEKTVEQPFISVLQNNNN
jgi:hypothetical protein